MDSPNSIDLCENDKLKVPDDGSRSPRPSTGEIQKSNMVLRRRMTNTSKKRYTTPSLPKVPHIRTEMASPDRSQENYPNYEIISNHSMVSNTSDKSFREKDHPLSRPGSRLFRDCNSPSGLGLPRENTHASLATRSVNSRASIRSNLSAISHLSQTSTQYNNNHRSQSNMANTTQSNNALNRSQTCRTSGNRKIPVFRKTVLRNMANGNLNLSASFNAAADGNLIRSSSLYQRKNLGHNARHQVSKLAQTLSADKRRFGSTTNTPIIDKRSEMLTHNRPPSFHLNVRQPTLDIGVESTPLTRKNFNFDKLSPISPTASLNNAERTERSKRNWRKALVGIQKLTPEDIEENLQLQNTQNKSNVNNKISKINRRLSKYANNYKSGTALNSIDINNTGNMATTKDSQKPKLNAAGLREIVNQVIEMQQNTKDKERDLEKSQKWKMKQFASCKKRFGTKLKEPEVLKQISNCQSFGNSHEIADTTYNNFGKQFSVSREKSMDLLDKSLSNNRLNLNVNPFDISASTGVNSKNMVRRQKSAHVTQKSDKQGFSGKMSLLKLSKSLRIANRLGNNNNNNTGNITSSTDKLDKKTENNSRTEQNLNSNTVPPKKDEKRSSVYGPNLSTSLLDDGSTTQLNQSDRKKQLIQGLNSFSFNKSHEVNSGNDNSFNFNPNPVSQQPPTTPNKRNFKKGAKKKEKIRTLTNLNLGRPSMPEINRNHTFNLHMKGPSKSPKSAKINRNSFFRRNESQNHFTFENNEVQDPLSNKNLISSIALQHRKSEAHKNLFQKQQSKISYKDNNFSMLTPNDELNHSATQKPKFAAQASLAPRNTVFINHGASIDHQVDDTSNRNVNPSVAQYGWRMLKYAFSGGELTIDNVVKAITDPELIKENKKLEQEKVRRQSIILQDQNQFSRVGSQNFKEFQTEDIAQNIEEPTINEKVNLRKSKTHVSNNNLTAQQSMVDNITSRPSDISISESQQQQQFSMGMVGLTPGAPKLELAQLTSLTEVKNDKEVADSITRYKKFKRNVSISGNVPNLRQSRQSIRLRKNPYLHSGALVSPSLVDTNEKKERQRPLSVINQHKEHLPLPSIDEVQPASKTKIKQSSASSLKVFEKVPLKPLDSAISKQSQWSDKSVFTSQNQPESVSELDLPELSFDKDRKLTETESDIFQKNKILEKTDTDKDQKEEIYSDENQDDEPLPEFDENGNLIDPLTGEYLEILDPDISEEPMIQRGEMEYPEEYIRQIESLDREDPTYIEFMNLHRIIENDDGIPYIYNHDLGLYLPYLEVTDEWTVEDKKNYRIMMNQNGDQVSYNDEEDVYETIEMTIEVLREYLEQIREELRILYDLAGTPYYFDHSMGHCVPATMGEEELEHFYKNPENLDEYNLYTLRDEKIPRQPGGMLAAGWVTPKENINKEVVDQFNEMPDYRPFFTYWVTTVQVAIMIITLIQFELAPFGFNMMENSSSYNNYQVGSSAAGRTKIFSVLHEESSPEKSMNFWIGPKKQDLIQLGVKYAPCIRWDRKLQNCYNRYSKSKNGCCTQKYTVGRDGLPFCTNLSEEECREYHFVGNQTCNQENSSTGDQMNKCSIIARPCCLYNEGRCEITTKEWCDRLDGIYNHDATTCDQVNCLEKSCKLLPFFSNENGHPDQWYRLFLSLFIHYGLLDLVISIVIQMTLVRDIEVLCGWRRTSIIFLISGILGNVASVIFSPYTPDAGPTPAHFGILACSYVEMVQLWPMFVSPWKALLKYIGILIALLILGLLPWMDNFSNIAGFFSGIFMAFFLIPYVVFNESDRKYKKIKRYFFIFIFIVYLITLIVTMYSFQSHEDYQWLDKVNCITNNPMIESWITSLLGQFRATGATTVQSQSPVTSNGRLSSITLSSIFAAKNGRESTNSLFRCSNQSFPFNFDYTDECL